MNLDQAIKKIISDNGADILKDRRFVSLLSDYQAFGQMTYAANMLRQIYANGYGTKIHKLYSNKDKTETAAFLSELRNKLGFDIEMLGKVFYAFSLPIQKVHKQTQQPSVKNYPSQNYTDLEIVIFDGRKAYKDEYGGIYSYPNCEIFYKLDNTNISIYSVRQGTKMMYKCAFVSNYEIVDDNIHCYHNKSEIQIVTLPDTLTLIPDYCFSHCKKLSQINIPNSIISIGKYAFEYCESLRKISIPTSVHSVESGIFLQCCSLAEITLPKSLEPTINSIRYSNNTRINYY